MHCPRCGYPQYCGCQACAPHLPDGYKPSVIRDDCLYTCAECGFEMPMEWWEDLSYDIWLRYRDRGDEGQTIDNDRTWREYKGTKGA